MQKNVVSTDPVYAKLRTVRLLIALAAVASFVFSVTLYFGFDKQAGIFVGIWVPSILSGGQFLMAGGSDV